jgi:hypothetical protein
MESEVKQTHTKEIMVVLQDEGLRKLKGFVQIPKAILLCQDISYGAKVAYSILLSYAWQDEFCFPAQESLANDLGCSVRQARRFLVELKEQRFVSWKQVGLNKPNVYYLLPLPEVKKNNAASKETMKNMDGTSLSHPKRTYLSHQEQTNMSAYKYSSNNNHNNVNVDKEGKGRGVAIEPKTDLHKLPDLDQSNEQSDLLASDILAELGDVSSTAFYRLVAAKIPESFIRQKLSELKQGSARTPERVFASIVRNYAAEKLAKQKIQSLSLTKQGLFRIGSS